VFLAHPASIPHPTIMCRFWVLVLAFAAGSALSQANEAAAEDAELTHRFHDLLDAEWEYTLREAPTFASHLGDKRYNGRWPDVSLGEIERRHQHQKDVLAKLDQIDPQTLPVNDRLNYLLFRKEVCNEIEQYPYHWHLVPLNQREGIQDESQLAD